MTVQGGFERAGKKEKQMFLQSVKSLEAIELQDLDASIVTIDPLLTVTVAIA